MGRGYGPSSVVLLLLSLYLISTAGILGYHVNRGGIFLGCFVLLLMCASLLLVIDLDNPASGSIREEQAPLEHVREALGMQPLHNGF